MKKFGFNKEEKLKSKKTIAKLFEEGQQIYKYPIKAFYSNESLTVSKAGFSASKRNHKKAVSRNKLKRRMREAYRLNKDIIGLSAKLNIIWLYTSKEIEDYKTIEKSMIHLLNELALRNSIAST